MAFSESTRIAMARIEKLEPEFVKRIIGCVLLQEHNEYRMEFLAKCPNVVLQKFIHEVIPMLPPISPSINSTSHFSVFSPVLPRPVLSPGRYRVQPPYFETQIAPKQHSSDFLPHELFCLEERMEGLRLRNPRFSSDGFYPDAAELGNARAGMGYRVNEFPVEACHYFNKGFCKHGSTCRYFHGPLPAESFPQVFGHSMDDDYTFLPSLDNLEMEIVDLLKSRRGTSVSIASLPTIYFERYGKILQAEGYLTESQRHGKAGYSLTKLLARLKNSIKLIDRPHGQHAVILAEDTPKYMEGRFERNNPGPIVSGSRQLYLTFPAASIFTEDDVCNYFSTYGPVEDVRIPCQLKRMFGFVTFTSSDTVHTILSKGNPHFVCGARVLVKPYREKLKLLDRNHQERYVSSDCYAPHYLDTDFDIHSIPGYDPRLLKKYFMEERERIIELERKRIAELQFTRKPMSNFCNIDYSMDSLKESEDQFNFPSEEHFNYIVDVLDPGSTDGKIRHSEITYTNHDSDVPDLPDSPFASSNL